MSKQPINNMNFSNEAAERQYWESHNSSEAVDWSRAQAVTFPNLKPSTKSISIRLSESMLDRIKVEAHKRDVPYQSLIKVWLSEHLETAA